MFHLLNVWFYKLKINYCSLLRLAVAQALAEPWIKYKLFLLILKCLMADVCTSVIDMRERETHKYEFMDRNFVSH